MRQAHHRIRLVVYSMLLTAGLLWQAVPQVLLAGQPIALAAEGSAAPLAAAPTLTATPEQIPYGSLPTITMTGAGYSAGESITITGGPFTDFQVNADGSGGFTAQRQPNSNGYLGVYRINAHGVSSNTDAAADVFFSRFDIYNNTDGNNYAVAQGSSANLTFQVWGLQRSEAVVISTDPPGLFATQNVSTDGGGHFCCPNLNTNAGAAPGAYTITAQGGTSGPAWKLTRTFNVISATLTPAPAVVSGQPEVLAGQHPTVTINASGLTPNGSVSVYGGPFGSSVNTADASGNLTLQEPVVSSNAGRYIVYIADNSSGGRAGFPLYLTANWFYRNPSWRDSDEYYYAAGFFPGETVHFTVNPAGPFTAFDATADGNGSVNGVRHDLSGVAAGQYTVTAAGQTSGFSSTNVLSVQGFGMALNQTQVAFPGSGGYSLSATGFAPNEYVDITDSGHYCCANPFPNFTVQADANGAFLSSLQSVGGYGWHQLRAHGRTSAVDNYADFYITGIDLSWGSFVAANTARSQYLQGFGFKPGEAVKVTSNPPGLFPDVTYPAADGNGNIFPTLSINAVAARDYDIVATGQTSGYIGTARYHVGSFALSPNAMVAGVASDITFSGAGYNPGETIEIRNDAGNDLFATFTTQADSSGAFSVTRTMSGSGCCGYWTWAYARGLQSGIQQQAQIHKLSLSADRYSSVAGTAASFNFYIRGFQPSGTAQLRGNGLFADRPVNLDGGGNANVNISVDTAAPAGAYTITAEDSGNSFAASVSYKLEPAAAGNPVLHLDTTPRRFNANSGDTQVQTVNVGLDNSRVI